MSEPKILTGLHPYEYEHPFDAKALNTLENSMGLDLLIRKYYKHAVERVVNINCTGSNLRITNQNYPKIYGLFEQACDIINLPSRPEFYLEWNYNINGCTIGIDNPIIILTSGSIDLLSEDELLFVIGHEIGHIKSRHQLYHQIGDYFPRIADTIGQATLGLGKLAASPIQIALFLWSRMSELTADRAGLLTCQDFQSAVKVKMKWAGMPIKHFDDMKIEAFIEQARQFESLDYNKLNKMFKTLSILKLTHPWTVMRTAELLKWIESGEYQEVLDRKTCDRTNVRYEGDSQYCRKCGYRLHGTEKFCNSCGQELNRKV